MGVSAEDVRDAVHPSGTESLYALLKRGHHGTDQRISVLHLLRYLTEFTGCLNHRDLDSCEEMEVLARGLLCNNLMYPELREVTQAA